MTQYLELLEDIMKNGVDGSDRTGTGTRSVFGRQLRFDLQQGFPLVTTKKLHLKSIIYELLWFIKGDTNIQYLKDNGVKIWDGWADENGDLGNIYGKQWRDCNGVDQLQVAINNIKNDPKSRRIIVDSWNVGELGTMALTPCHCLFQFYVANGKLSCQLYQRSADVFLGVPFNIASYALLTHMIANICDLEVGEFIHTFGDAHIYNNHFNQVKTQLSRDPKNLSTLRFIKNKYNNIEDFKFEDIVIDDYESWGILKGKVSI